jgi:hypothetical protein
MYLDFFFKCLPWPLDIHGSKLSFYRNIFLSQYREQKSLVCNGPKREAFLYESVLRGCYGLTIWVCKIWQKESGKKAARYMLVKLMPCR